MIRTFVTSPALAGWAGGFAAHRLPARDGATPAGA